MGNRIMIYSPFSTGLWTNWYPDYGFRSVLTMVAVSFYAALDFFVCLDADFLMTSRRFRGFCRSPFALPGDLPRGLGALAGVPIS